MKDKVFSILQRAGRSFMLPIAILPVAGLLLGIGSSFTNETTIVMYGLEKILGNGTILHAMLVIMNKVGSVVFDNLPVLFAVGIAIGMAKKEKEVSALSAVVGYLVMNTAIYAMLTLHGEILENGDIVSDVLEGTITSSCGIPTLQMGIFGGIIVGLGVASLHNRFYKIVLPNALSFFGGTRFVPIISTIVYMFVGIFLYFIWPPVQNEIYALGGLVTGSGYLGTLLFGLIKRALIPFGLHHVFYMPFWQTAVGGTMEVAGEWIQGGQNIFFAQLADSANVMHFSADATRYFSGEFIFMIFGLPGAALAMYHCARPEKKKAAGGLFLSAALACMVTGITEPLEFSFLFVAPALFVVQVILAGSAYMVAHILNIAVGLTFSGGFLDFFLFGILQGNDKTSWLLVIPAGIVYFILYYVIFRFMILKFDFKTPGREEDDAEIKLYTRADINARNADTGQRNDGMDEEDLFSADIIRGLGGKGNISDVDCCATRLRCTVYKAELVNDAVLKNTGASGVLQKGNSVQVIYGPHVTVIKSNLEDYLEKVSDVEMADVREEPVKEEIAAGEKEAKVVRSILISSPVTGTAADLSETPDAAFADKMMGDGAVVMPEDPLIKAPADGEVNFVFDTKHAVGFLTNEGIRILIHVGIDTVKLGGKGFEVLAKEGQRVKKGDPLLRADLEYLKKHVPSIATPVVCMELEDNQRVRLLKQGKVQAGEALFAVDILE
ncbi:MAG: glucose PTS transporter subunit IIA [Lachnospiraceae bacterium]|jgi:glucose-specific phosphotransferase system IIA component